MIPKLYLAVFQKPRQMLGGYFTIKKLKQDKLEDISEQTQQKYFFKSSGALPRK